MADFMPMKCQKGKSKQSQIANQLSYSTSNLQRYRNDINLVSPYRIQPNNTNKRIKKASKTIFDNNSHRKHDFKRPQITPNDLNTTQRNTKSNKKNKNIPKAGFKHENFDINDQYLDEILDNKDI